MMSAHQQFPIYQSDDGATRLDVLLEAEIHEEMAGMFNNDTSRAFEKPKSGRIAVKVINHLGDEVMKVFRV